MQISMQGPWIVAIVSKNASFAQRVVITTGDRVEHHAGEPLTQIDVRAGAWTIAVEHSPDGKTWQRSAVQLQQFQSAPGRFSMRIASNDSGSDRDYDDLVLECVTTLGSFDHVVYGRVRAHQGCLINPCHLPRYWVIDNRPALELLAKQPAGARLLEQARVDTKLLAESERLTPVMLPLEPSGPVAPTLDRNDLREVAKLADLFKWRCKSRPLTDHVISFCEYDRTGAERLGEPYTGTGVRAPLGQTTTDEQGWYVFRFTRSVIDVLDEAFNDGGSDPNVGYRPDLIAAVLDSTGAPFYETAPRFDVANVHRFDLCVPAGMIPPAHELEPGARYIQLIGDINLLSPNVELDGGYVSNRLPPAGAGPAIERGAWSGTLRISAMFPGGTRRYALRYRTIDGVSRGPWRWHGASFTRYSLTSGRYLEIGSTLTQVVNPDLPSERIDIPTYLDIYGDPRWLQPTAAERAYLATASLRSSPGQVELQVFAWDASGQLLGSDRETLFVDDRRPTGEIHFVDVGPNVTPQHECPLLELQPSQVIGPLLIRFEVRDAGGLLDNWRIDVHRGKNTPLGRVTQAVSDSERFGREFDQWFTPNQPWLPIGHDLCAFSFTLHAQSRRTDGRNVHPQIELWRELVAIRQR